MARYDYKCETCNKIIEIQKSIKEFEKIEPCEECKKPMIKLPPSQTSFSLKGTGWYQSDYKRQGK